MTAYTTEPINVKNVTKVNKLNAGAFKKKVSSMTHSYFVGVTSSGVNAPLTDYKKYSQTLHQRTVFHYTAFQSRGSVSAVVLSFRFRTIEFSKKRALPFFLAIELLTHRKCVASLSGRNVQAWKVRKGRLVGCKVTLRREGLDDFVDLLGLTLPRMEKFQAPRGFIANSIKKTLAKQNSARKTSAAITQKVKVFKVTPSFSLSLNEIVLFYPVELGLGLHADVQQVIITYLFSAYSIEEQFFLLRHSKVPVLYLGIAIFILAI